MKTLIIYNSVYEESVKIANEALESFNSFKDWNPVLWDGCTPETLDLFEKMTEVSDGKQTKPFTKDLYYNKKSCFFSHYTAWFECMKSGEPYAFVEHDTICLEDYKNLDDYKDLNGRYVEIDWSKPVGVQLTTQSMLQYTFKNRRKNKEKLDNIGEGLHKIWYVHPHGKKRILGGTGYILTPSACRILIEDCLENGWTQNDLLFDDSYFPLYYLYPSPVKYVKEKELKSSSILLERKNNV